jgi:hypothetical protein
MQLTQLFVILAKIIAQDGAFDNSKRSGGNWPSLAGESVLPAWINLNSDLLTKGLSLGSLVTPFAHLVSHSSPREEKRIKGPEIPTVDSIIGVSNKPMTFPR